MKFSVKTPKLTLVGAGPGDPELITIKAIKALREADVVLYDALVNKELLEYCLPTCEVIYVGKKPDKKSISQDSINFLIVEKAFELGHVVRLKGGDPFIFGRGQEEIEFAEKFNIQTSYIPGISSVQSSGNVNIPLTARGISESFWVITGTKSDGSLSEDLKKAAQTTATVVVLMGMNKLAKISEIYQKLDRGNIPAAIIQWGTLENQKTTAGLVKELADLAMESNLTSPAIIVIGEVVRLYKPEKIRELIKQSVVL